VGKVMFVANVRLEVCGTRLMAQSPFGTHTEHLRWLQQIIRSEILRPMRKIGLATARKWPWPVSAKLRNGRSMFVDLRSPIGRGIYMKGEFDPSFFIPLSRVLREGDTFLDVGANVGYYSMLALDHVGASGCIHAFEIDERPLRCLRKTRQHFNISNLIINPIAVGEQSGAAFFLNDADCGHSRLCESDKGREVAMTCLDDWWIARGSPRIKAIKMDIEGAEVLALRGAQSLIQAERPTWVCEALDMSSTSMGAAAAILQDKGYRIEQLTGVDSPAFVARPE
jgi:FkbM family methyltransferase